MQGSLVLNCICNVKYEAFFTLAMPFLDRKQNFMIFFGSGVFFKMKLNNFLVGSFLSGIGLLIEFCLQSAFIEILESFLNTNTLWSFNLCGLITPNLIHIIYNESITRLYN